jgi:hypothetical protein
MESLNLNVNEYTDKELEEILAIEYPYQREDIINSKSNLLNKLTRDSEVDYETKGNIESFLNDVTNRLVKTISSLSQTNNYHSHIDKFSDLKNEVIEVNDNMLIKNQKLRKEAYSLPSYKGLNIGNDGGAPPGIINPIKFTTIKRALNIDSRFRPNYYQSNASDQRLTLPYRFENVINMRLASIEIPLTYYSISKSQGNNSLIVGWNFHEASNGELEPTHIVKVEIPDGNYETQAGPQPTGASSIESVINAALQNPHQTILYHKPGVTPQTIYSDPSFSLVYTVDRTSGRSIFSIDPSGIQQYSDVITENSGNALRYKIFMGTDGNLSNQQFKDRDVNVDPLTFFLGWQLGFRVNIYDSGPSQRVQLRHTDISANVPPAAVVSEGICYVKGPQYIFVAIDDYNNNVNNYYISAYTDSINSNNIIARINMASIQQSNGVYQTGEDDGFSTQINRSRQYFGPVNIEKLRLTLYDEYGRVVNLNNMDWSCALMFEQIYEGGNILS